jgi:hypothetical protein
VGGVTTTAGRAAGFSTGGGATTAGAVGLTTGGVTTALLSAAGAAGLDTAAAGFSAEGGGAAGAVFAGAGGAAGGAVAAGILAGGAGGCCCCCSLSLSSLATSPGLEILERSIFGLTSVADVFSRADEPDLAEKCFRTRTASSSSIELEWVFFSVTPTSGKISKITLAFTSSSLARSLIRIFIRSLFPPSTCYAIIMTSRFFALNLTTKVLLPILHPALPIPALPTLHPRADLHHACALQQRPHQARSPRRRLQQLHCPGLSLQLPHIR